MRRVRVLPVLVLAASLGIAALAVVAHALYAREAVITPRINWTGHLVLLELPSSLFPSGTTGIYVSNASDCSTSLPTWWASIGGIVYVLYNDTRTLEAGRDYRVYICYGDILAPQAWELFPCDLPGHCDINHTDINATLTNTTVTVSIGGHAETATINLTDVEYTAAHSYSIDIGGYLDTLEVYTNTTYPWSLTAELIVSGTVVDNAVVELYDTYDTTNTTSYDTGTVYYDTGVVTVYSTPYPMYVKSLNITINVYDSDRDTYYVYLYINGSEAGRWYTPAGAITYTAYNMSIQSVSIRVYDTERNDWVRAWGTVSVAYTHYLAKARLGGAYARDGAVLRIAADREFTLDGDNATATYYPAANASAKIVFDTINGFVVVYRPRVVGDGALLAYNVSTAAAEAGAMWSLLPGSIVLVGDDRSEYNYDTHAVLALSIDTAAVNLPTYGQYDYEAVTTVTPRASTLNLTLLLTATPGTYNLTWERLLAADALTNYTILVGAAYVPTQQTGTGGTAGNTTVNVNVQVENPYATNYWLATIAAVSSASLAASIWFYIRAWRVNRLDYAILAFAIGMAGSIVVFALGEDRIARILLVAESLLMVYSVAERTVDALRYALRGRMRKPY